MKRFQETTIFNQNKWFRELEMEHKLLWYYINCACDNVGVWVEDLELAGFTIKCEFDKEEVIKIFGDRIKILDDTKWWIIDFCKFQYAFLIEGTESRPLKSYIKLLKSQNLYNHYLKTIKCDSNVFYSLKDKDRDKDKEKEQDNSINNNYKIPVVNEVSSKKDIPVNYEKWYEELKENVDKND